ncbi:nitrile hydratase subunit beta, partial [Pseudomonadota bacterium]
EGYGPIDVDDDGRSFHHDWEGREWGIAQCARTPGITIDWWRHCRELIMPEDYLARPYFDSWAQTDFSTYIEAGWITMEEVIEGSARPGNPDHGDSPAPMSLQQVVQEDRSHAFRFDASIEAEPAFNIGQCVRTSGYGNVGHTRLPQYARGRHGVVHAWHGAHVFPDLSAQGVEVHQHLYSVSFTAAELWPEARNGKDRVYLDLWESYLSDGQS